MLVLSQTSVNDLRWRRALMPAPLKPFRAAEITAGAAHIHRSIRDRQKKRGIPARSYLAAAAGLELLLYAIFFVLFSN
jgi:hypothetical protein